MTSTSKPIALLSWDDKNGKGGLGKSIAWHIDVMQKLGYSVNALTPERGFLPFTKRLGHIVFSLLVSVIGVSSHKYQVLLTPVGPGGVWILRPLRTRVIALCYHTYRQQTVTVPGQWWKALFIPLEWLMLKRASSIWCYSADTKQFLEDRYAIPSSKIVLLPQIVDVQPKEVQLNTTQRCICIGRLDQRKGINVVLTAWQKVLKACPNATLEIVGSGQKSLERQVANTPAVLHSMQLTRDELFKRIARAQLLLSASYLEGFGLTVLEAMLLGTAVCVTDVDGHRAQIQPNKTGVLVPPGDPKALAAAITGLLNNADQCYELAQYAQTTAVEKCSTKRISKSLQQALSALYSDYASNTE